MENVNALEVPGYQLVQYLGSGARSTVWQIKDRQTEEVFALKRVIKRSPVDQRYLDQAVNEYNVGSRINHPVIRRILSIRRVRRWLALREVHLVMEWCEGTSIQDNRPEDLKETVRVFAEVAKGLAFMNTEGFVHADMKPNNIIVAANGTVKVIDLGQSCPVGTVKERIQGTPDFIAPEQVNRQALDGRTDVFNFGASLYWTLTGRAIPTIMPKKGELTLKSDHTYVPPEKIDPQIPLSLSKLVSDCIEYQVTRRPSSMNEVVSRLNLIAHSLHRRSGNP